MSLILTDKQLDNLALAIRNDVHMICHEGAIRSGKTITMIEMFYLAVKYSNDNLHCVCAKDYDAIRDNILHSNGLGLLDLFNDVKLVKERIGGYYLQLIGADGMQKTILLAGYGNNAQWKKILGKTIGVFFIDECNIADEQFIDECFARQVSASHSLMLLSLNGDVPDHFIYQKYINYCKPIGKVPSEILGDMNKVENRKGCYYYHWTMHDNPIMTKDKIERAESIYPKDSFYYKIKILGIRGNPEGAIFAQYLTEDFISKNIDEVYEGKIINIDELEFKLKTNKFIKYAIGIDLGNNDIKRGTILTLTGIERAYKSINVLDSYQCKATEANALVQEISNKIEEWYYEIQNPTFIDSIRIDGYGSVQVIVPTIRKELQKRRIFTLCDLALKFNEDGRKARLNLLLLMVGQKRIKFSQREGAKKTFQMLKRLVYDEKDGMPLDENQEEMDFYDSLGYSITPFTTSLTNALRKI